jgi:hypothetical protein
MVIITELHNWISSSPYYFVNFVHFTPFLDFSFSGNRKVSKAISVTGRGGLRNCETSRIPHCLDNRLIDVGCVVSLTRRPRSTSQKHFLVLVSVKG